MRALEGTVQVNGTALAWLRRASIGAFSLALAALNSSPAAAQPATTLTPQAVTQIQALLAEKESRTPAQKKIDSQLIYAARMAAGQAIAQGIATLEVDVPVEDGLADVIISGKVSPKVLVAIESLGGTVLSSSASFSTVHALVPLDRLEKLASFSDVRWIGPNYKPQVEKTGRVVRGRDAVEREDDLPPAKDRDGRLERVREYIESVIAEEDGLVRGMPAGPEAHAAGIVRALIGSRNSQGDVTHRADVARSTYGVNGAGLKIGVISDSFNNLGGAAADVAAGDLPGPGNPNGFFTPVQFAGTGDLPSGGTDEGRAMVQIVHDVAPGAELYFATAYNTPVDFANNILALRAAGCDIIIDDIFYFVETGLHKGQSGFTSPNNCGVVIEAVNVVTAAGAMYFSSAGNSGSVTQGTAGAWEGDYVSGGTLTGPIGTFPGGDVLDWDQTAAVSQSAGLTATSRMTVHWSDPLGASTNDYDLFVLNSTLTAVTTASTNLQTGTQDPFEQTGSGIASGNRLVLLKKAGAADRFISLSTNRGRMQFGTTGQTRGHSTAENGFGVAATPAAATFGPPTPIGPYPGTFTGTNQVESFSSDGPRKVFFNADGTAITAGNFLSTGGAVLQKPDVTAADGVDTTLPGASGLNPFYGTSAAAPHAGAIAALVKAAAPTFTPAQIRACLTTTAIDIMTAGVDNVSGVGILDAFAAVQCTGAVGVASLALGTQVLLETTGNGNGAIESGESGSLTVQLRNFGVVDATAISATLTTSTPGVTITNGSATYPDIPQGGGSGAPSTAFTFDVSPSFSCPGSIAFFLNVTYTGGPSPRSFGIPVRVGPPAISVSSSLSTTAPTLPAGVAGATSQGLQVGRMTRSGVPSTCAGKSFPGLFLLTGNRQYHAYTFTTPTGTGPSSYCVSVSLTNASTTLYSAAYLGPYVPASYATNYVGDAGSSVNGTAAYQFTVPAGRTFTVVVHEVNAAGGIGQAYTLKIDGLCGTVTAPDPLGGPAVVAEVPANSDSDGFVETCEEATVSIPVTNAGTGNATNVSMTVSTSTPNVVLTNATTTYPDIASGVTQSPATPLRFRLLRCAPCGTTVALTTTFTADGISPVVKTVNVPTGGPFTTPVFSEAFDGVTAPALPAGWTAAAAGFGTGTPGAPWASTATTPDSAPNAAFTDAPTSVDQSSTNDLVSPAITLPLSASQLSFRHTRNFESSWDGGVLEVSVAAGPFVDVTSPSIGGVFTAGGYNLSINASAASAIAGRPAWTGAQATYVTSSVNLPFTLGGQSVQFRWRATWDSNTTNPSPNWRIDGITILGQTCSTTAACLPATTDPVPTSINCGGNATFSVTGTAALGPVSYQWRLAGNPLLDGGNISGAATASLSINPTTVADVGTYDCVVTEAGCSTISAGAALTLNPDVTPPVVTAPANITIVASECGAGGPPSPQQATSGTSATLSTFLSAGTALDACGAAMLAPQVGGLDVTAATGFPLGTTTVTFRAQDAVPNVGTATATVAVEGWADLDGDNVAGATDLTILANHLIGLITPQGPGSPWTRAATRGNVSNPAGSINGVDQVLIQNYLVGNLACLPQ